MMRTTRGFALTIVTIALAAGSASADNSLDQAFSVRALSMGGALRGAATGGAAPLNPAGVALIRAYTLEGSYGYRGGDGATLINASVADSITSRLGTAIYYSYMGSTNERTITTDGITRTVTDDRSRHELGSAFAMPLSERFVIGVTPKYTGYAATTRDGTTETTLHDKDRFNLDAGAVIGLSPNLTIGVVGYNLVYHDVSYPRGLGAGVALGLGQRALIGADVVVDKTTTGDDADSPDGTSKQSARASAGAELLLANLYPLRIGGSYDSRDDNAYISGGTGYLSERVGLDVGFRRQLRGGDETIVIVGLKFLLPTEDQNQTPTGLE